MQEKESIKAVLGQIENSVTQDNCSASLGKLRDAKHPCDGICNPHLTQRFIQGLQNITVSPWINTYFLQEFPANVSMMIQPQS